MSFNSSLRKIGSTLNKWLLVILKPLQIVGNFVFLGIAYFIGVGFSALLYRIGPGRIKKRTEKELLKNSADQVSRSLWTKLPPASTNRDSWLRPF